MEWLNNLVTVLVEQGFGLDVNERLGGSIHFFIYDVIKIFILLSVLIFVISYIQSFFTPEKTKRILMLIDGFVNEFENVGFFAEKVDLNVWDTIAAHDSGLGTIAKIFGKSRKKTTTEVLNLPYRNGILHGRI